MSRSLWCTILFFILLDIIGHPFWSKYFYIRFFFHFFFCLSFYLFFTIFSSVSLSISSSISSSLCGCFIVTLLLFWMSIISTAIDMCIFLSRCYLSASLWSTILSSSPVSLILSLILSFPLYTYTSTSLYLFFTIILSISTSLRLFFSIWGSENFEERARRSSE